MTAPKSQLTGWIITAIGVGICLGVLITPGTQIVLVFVGPTIMSLGVGLASVAAYNQRTDI